LSAVKFHRSLQQRSSGGSLTDAWDGVDNGIHNVSLVRRMIIKETKNNLKPYMLIDQQKISRAQHFL
jgi:hypothetical protein